MACTETHSHVVVNYVIAAVIALMIPVGLWFALTDSRAAFDIIATVGFVGIVSGIGIVMTTLYRRVRGY